MGDMCSVCGERPAENQCVACGRPLCPVCAKNLTMTMGRDPSCCWSGKIEYYCCQDCKEEGGNINEVLYGQVSMGIVTATAKAARMIGAVLKGKDLQTIGPEDMGGVEDVLGLE